VDAVTELRFEGRVAIITGAGRGIGRAHAELLASRGAHVVVNDVGAAVSGVGVSKGPADEVVASIESRGGSAVASYDSVADPACAKNLVNLALERFGRVDILVNNAGNAIPKPFSDLTEDDFESVLTVHYGGTRRLCRAVWPQMVGAGYGRIVNTTSASIRGLPNWSAYAAAKAAIIGLTLSIATEARDHGITVNALSPGAGSRLAAETADRTPAALADRMATKPPAKVSPVLAYLVHESCALNGVILKSAGGTVSQMRIASTVGFSNPNLTPEDVRDNLDQILDLTTMRAEESVG
jgi:NAD(P)-dependent dehydrogenase (short-subunit alcohol dehydrogenase family)